MRLLALGTRQLKAGQHAAARQSFGRSGKGAAADLTATLLTAWSYAGANDGKRALDTVNRLRGERYFNVFRDYHAGLIANLVGDMKQCPEPIQLRMVWHFWHADADYGRRVAEGAGIDLEKAKALPPLPGRAAPGKRLTPETYTEGGHAPAIAAE